MDAFYASVEQRDDPVNLEIHLIKRFLHVQHMLCRHLDQTALSPEIVDAMVDQGSMADQPLSHFIAGLPFDWHDQGSRLRQR